VGRRVRLDEGPTGGAIYSFEGLGHAFLALHRRRDRQYLCSQVYGETRDTAWTRWTEIGIAWPSDVGCCCLTRGRRSAVAGQARADGLLPTYRDLLTLTYVASFSAIRLELEGQRVTIGPRVLRLSGKQRLSGDVTCYRVQLPRAGYAAVRRRRPFCITTTGQPASRNEADIGRALPLPGGQDLRHPRRTVAARPNPPLITYDVGDLVLTPSHLAGMDFLTTLTPVQQETFTKRRRLARPDRPDTRTARHRELGNPRRMAQLTDAPAAPAAERRGPGRCRLADARR
jgi:hypothetical protein